VYETLKLLHVGAVVLSGAGFVARYAFAVRHGRLPGGALRVAPHAVDTVLLASALAMAWIAGFRPLHDPWLEAKLAGLVVYILSGTIALKRGRTPRARSAAFAAALLAYAYIVSVALTKNPLGPFAGGQG